jgi:hypothetical protein
LVSDANFVPVVRPRIDLEALSCSQRALKRFTRYESNSVALVSVLLNSPNLQLILLLHNHIQEKRCTAILRDKLGEYRVLKVTRSKFEDSTSRTPFYAQWAKDEGAEEVKLGDQMILCFSVEKSKQDRPRPMMMKNTMVTKMIVKKRPLELTRRGAIGICTL